MLFYVLSYFLVNNQDIEEYPKEAERDIGVY